MRAEQFAMRGAGVAVQFVDDVLGEGRDRGFVGALVVDGNLVGQRDARVIEGPRDVEPNEDKRAECRASQRDCGRNRESAALRRGA